MKKSPRPNSQARIKKTKLEFLEHLKQAPIIQLVCEKMGIARSTVYRWMKEDIKFNNDVEDAIEEGDKFFDDLVESKLMSLINERHWQAMNCYMKRRHPKFKVDKPASYNNGEKLSLLDLAKETADEEEEEEEKRKKGYL